MPGRAFLISLFTANQIFAKGQPTEWQLGFQEAGSPLMQQLIDFHDFVFWIITAITVFVFLLLAYVCVRFSAKNNKKPSTTTHNATLEIAWTLIPVLLLVVVGITIPIIFSTTIITTSLINVNTPLKRRRSVLRSRHLSRRQFRAWLSQGCPASIPCRVVPWVAPRQFRPFGYESRLGAESSLSSSEPSCELLCVKQ